MYVPFLSTDTTFLKHGRPVLFLCRVFPVKAHLITIRTGANNDGIAPPPGGYDGAAVDMGDPLGSEKSPFQISSSFDIVIFGFDGEYPRRCCRRGCRGGCLGEERIEAGA